MVYTIHMSKTGRPPLQPRSAIGERIAEARIRSGFSQTELAEKLGIKQQSVTALERRDSIPRGDTLLKLCEILNVTPNDLLGIANPTSKTPTKGRLYEVFQDMSKLPRRQQGRILDVIEAMLTANQKSSS